MYGNIDDVVVSRDSPQQRGEKVYAVAQGYAKWLAGSQFAVSLFGGVLHLVADGLALAFYTDMWNEIRAVYGKGAITTEAMKAYLSPNLAFIIGDLLLDKTLGMVPFAGSVFCYWFARALTFRLAALFGVLAALDEETPEAVVLEKVANLIQELYPRTSFLFTLADPDKATFVELLASMEGLEGAEAETRLETALNVLRGIYTVVEDEDDFAEEAEVVEAFQEYGMVLWQGADFITETDDSEQSEEDVQMPLPLDDELNETPVGVIPESLVPYWNGEQPSSRTVRESAEGTTDNNDSKDAKGNKPSHSPKTNAQRPPTKRKHVATGIKPSGRPKKS